MSFSPKKQKRAVSITETAPNTIVFSIALFSLPVVQLRERCLHFLRNRQSYIGGILQQRKPFIRKIKGYHRPTQCRSRSQHMHVHHVGNPHQHQNQYLFADSSEPDCTGKLPIYNGAHYARNIILCHEYNQCNQHAVQPSQKIPLPSAHKGRRHLNLRPDQFHRKIPHVFFLQSLHHY